MHAGIEFIANIHPADQISSDYDETLIYEPSLIWLSFFHDLNIT